VTSGYADQSHLAREVKRLSGLSPTTLRAERQDITVPLPTVGDVRQLEFGDGRRR
jgi:AraC-like DNA-binding protein